MEGGLFESGASRTQSMADKTVSNAATGAAPTQPEITAAAKITAKDATLFFADTKHAY
jgi:hypothetical protein